MNLDQRMYLMGKGLIALGSWAAVASVWAIVTSAGSAIDGELWGISRVIIGLVGLAGASILFAGRDNGRLGWTILLGWPALQLPYYATSPDHNLTRQLIDGLVGFSNETSINGEIVEYSAIGINGVGLVLLGVATSLRGRLDLWRRRAEPAPAT